MSGRSDDVIVIGVGAMGSATCRELARRGAAVLGIEQFAIGHDLGSSGGDTRLIRTAYFEHPDYVPLLRRAYELWDELDETTGRPVLHRTGAVYAGKEDGELVAGSLLAAKRHDLPHERIGPDELRRRYPWIQAPEGFAAVFEPDGGYLLSERAIVEMAGEARRHGATLLENERVRTWSADRDGVTVTTDRATYRARRLVVTAGAWSGAIAPDPAVSLRVTRQTLGWVRPPDLEPFREGRLPCWAIDHGEGLLYGVPVRRGESLLKVADHRPGETADPDRIDRTVSDHDTAGFLELLRRFVPSAVGPVGRAKICMYTNSPDGHFVVDRHPLHENVAVACGFSGHGFKFAPVIGAALADLVTEGRSSLPIGFLSRRRFEATPAP